MSKHKEYKVVAVIKRVFKVRSWFDWDRMKSFSVYVAMALKLLFVPQEKDSVQVSHESESFEAAQKAQNLTEEDLKTRQNALWRNSVLMIFFAIMLLFYAGYQLWSSHFKAGLISIVVTMIALALSFRYHFWYFQIKSRKLGCSVQEWFKEGLLGGKK